MLPKVSAASCFAQIAELSDFRLKPLFCTLNAILENSEVTVSTECIKLICAGNGSVKRSGRYLLSAGDADADSAAGSVCPGGPA